MVTVYGKDNLANNSKVLRELYMRNDRHVKLHGGKWYSIHYSQAQRVYYAIVAPIQRDV